MRPCSGARTSSSALPARAHCRARRGARTEAVAVPPATRDTASGRCPRAWTAAATRTALARTTRRPHRATASDRGRPPTTVARIFATLINLCASARCCCCCCCERNESHGRARTLAAAATYASAAQCAVASNRCCKAVDARRRAGRRCSLLLFKWRENLLEFAN